MSASSSAQDGAAPRAPPSAAEINHYLEENNRLLEAILQNQNMGRLHECVQYQLQLQQNLIYLATHADQDPRLVPLAMMAQVQAPDDEDDAPEQPKPPPFTREEDATILQMVHEIGKKWTKITKALPGRTDNQVRNRHNKLRRDARASDESAAAAAPAGNGAGALAATNGGHAQPRQQPP